MENSKAIAYITMDNANDREVIERILFLLELSQAREYQFMNSLVQQMESMENQIKELNIQLNEARTQIPDRKGIKEQLDAIYHNAIEKGKELLQMLKDIMKNIAQKGREWIGELKQNGELKFYSFLDKSGVQEKLCSIQQKMNSNIEGLKEDIQKLDNIENELRQSGSHFKSAVGMITGKESEMQKEEKTSNILSKGLRAALKADEKMLNKVNQAIAAYDRLENSVISKNPSVLKKIGQFKNETAKKDIDRRENNKVQEKVTEPER